jgi:hypothetical protein
MREAITELLISDHNADILYAAELLDGLGLSGQPARSLAASRTLVAFWVMERDRAHTEILAGVPSAHLRARAEHQMNKTYRYEQWINADIRRALDGVDALVVMTGGRR